MKRQRRRAKENRRKITAVSENGEKCQRRAKNGISEISWQYKSERKAFNGVAGEIALG